jgi:hypothetical protein
LRISPSGKNTGESKSPCAFSMVWQDLKRCGREDYNATAMTQKHDPASAEPYKADGTADQTFTPQEARKIKITIIISVVLMLLIFILQATGHLPCFLEDGKCM